jgi:hypothetical protein
MSSDNTAATVLLVLGVPERSVMGIMGWSSTAMAARYQHVTDPIRRTVAAQVGGLLWAEGKVSECQMRPKLRPRRLWLQVDAAAFIASRLVGVAEDAGFEPARA